MTNHPPSVLDTVGWVIRL